MAASMASPLSARQSASELPEAVVQCMQVFYGEYPDNVLIPYNFLQPQLQAPGVQARLAACMQELDRAIGLACCSAPASSPHGLKVLERLRSLQSLAPRWQQDSFHFYVAGGYVLSRVFGIGDYSDIDVWTSPMTTSRSAGGLVVATGKPFFPVNVLAVSNMIAFLESFDMHICSCAIRCSILKNGQRVYELCLTKSCARCLRAMQVHACPMHEAIAQQVRLADRMLKYYRRGLSVDLSLMEKFQVSVRDPEGMLPLCAILENTLQHEVPTPEFRSHWLVTLEAPGRIKAVSFGHGSGPIQCERLPGCSPAIVYPCRSNMHHLECADRARAGGGHWIVCALSDKPSLVALRGGSRVWSSLIVPDWFLERLTMTETELVSELLDSFPNYAAAHGETKVQIPASVPLQLIAIMRDWKCSCAHSGEAYSPEWCWFLDTGGSRSLPAMMFCTDTFHLCHRCVHAQSRDYHIY